MPPRALVRLAYLAECKDKQMYAFDGLSATVCSENHTSEELQKRLG
ncbi:MAG: hypothetical protein EZS28_041053, partial [Streblomastix strix]